MKPSIANRRHALWEGKHGCVESAHGLYYDVCADNLERINKIRHFYAPELPENRSIDKMNKYDRDRFRNYVEFLAGNPEIIAEF